MTGDIIARQWTEERLAAIERRITNIYTEAQGAIVKSWNAYMLRVARKLASLQKQYDAAKAAGDTEKAKEIGEKLGKAKASETYQNKRYKQMVNNVTAQLSTTNETAVAYLNEKMPSIYAMNYNAAQVEAEELGFDFTLVDEATVKRLIMDGEIKLPPKKINVPLDMAWNKKQINSQVLQGIIQGEPMKKIAERIFPEIMSKADLKGKTEKEIQGIIKKNKDAAIRNARTMVTGAENRGRFDRSTELERLGAVIEKRWIATPDNRTRDSHMALDGETRRKEQRFSNGLMFPGDPNGRPEEVYNCRCSMSTQIVGFVKDDGSIVTWGSTPTTTTLHERQMANERAKRAQ